MSQEHIHEPPHHVRDIQKMKQRSGRILSASELYEIAKQIKYKQLYSMQARSQNSQNQSPAVFSVQSRKVNDGIKDNLRVQKIT